LQIVDLLNLVHDERLLSFGADTPSKLFHDGVYPSNKLLRLRNAVAAMSSPVALVEFVDPGLGKLALPFGPVEKISPLSRLVRLMDPKHGLAVLAAEFTCIWQESQEAGRSPKVFQLVHRSTKHDSQNSMRKECSTII
jgi:hypothetical protein